MNRLTVAAHLSSQLDGLTQPIELCDERGLVLGHFVPRPADDPSISCPYSPEELRQLRAQGSGRALPEIWGTLAEK